jgi:hypothetical protein
MTSVVVSISVDAAIWRRFEAICAECSTDASSQVQELVHAWMDQQENPANRL